MNTEVGSAEFLAERRKVIVAVLERRMARYPPSPNSWLFLPRESRKTWTDREPKRRELPNRIPAADQFKMIRRREQVADLQRQRAPTLKQVLREAER